jgi:L-rhamnose mutarotase
MSICEIRVQQGVAGLTRHPTQGNGMKRVGFLLKVKADKLEEYKQHHTAVWPEMLDALRRTGWRNYSLFMREDGLLFGYFETPDTFQAALDGMAKEEINAKWQDFMAPYFENLSGAHADHSMVELEEVFHLD